MVEPKEEGGFLNTEGADFRARMIQYIRTHFSERLGEDAGLLDRPDGLARLSEKYVERPLRPHAATLS